jgi:hypothetical protein
VLGYDLEPVLLWYGGALDHGSMYAISNRRSILFAFAFSQRNSY